MSDETKVNVSNENGIPDPSESLTAMGMNSSVSSSCPAGAWRRFFARMLDFFVFSCILQIILVLFSLSFWLQLIILSFAIFFAIFLETVWYAKFKNTPGKYFFGCRVVDKHGSALTEKAYRTRNWAVYLQGFWCGGVASAIPFILQLPSPVTWSVVLLCAPLAIQHVMIESEGKPTTYDAPKSYSVIQISHSAAKTLIGLILFLLLSILPMISFIRFAMTGTYKHL